VSVQLDRAAATRNGLPGWKPYVYRGTGQDQKPYLGDEALAPYRGGYEQWIPDFARGSSAGRMPTEPCGTRSAYRRHKRLGEDPCESCKQAERRAWGDRNDNGARRQRYADALAAGMSPAEAKKMRSRGAVA
jgi:hypothetical protein